MPSQSVVSRRIEATLKAAYVDQDPEAALVHWVPALDKTAKRRRPKGGVGFRIKEFLADQESLIHMIAMNRPMNMRGIAVDSGGLPEAVYGFIRNSIAHEGEIDPKLTIVQSRTLSAGGSWKLGISYLEALFIAVICAPENSHERIDDRFVMTCLLYTSPSPRDQRGSRMPSSA